MSLTEAAKCCKSFESVRHSSKPLSDFVREYEAKREARVASGGRRAGGLTTIKKTFVKMKERFGPKILSDITHAPSAPPTRRTGVFLPRRYEITPCELQGVPLN